MNRIASTVVDAYDAWGATYDRQSNPTRDLSTLVLQRIVPELRGKTVVEAGCGTGWNSAWLAERCERLVGLDFSEGMLAIARRKVKQGHVEFLRHDVRSPWPMPRESADLVLINLVFEHIEFPADVLRHAANVLRPTAKLIVTEYHPDRIRAGRGAEILRPGEPTLQVANFWHPTSAYEPFASAAGLTLESLEAWTDSHLPDVPRRDDAIPRILSAVMGSSRRGTLDRD